MLLSIKEMEVRKLPFAETWPPGEIDFMDSAAVQTAPLVAQGVAELLPHTGGEVRVKGKVATSLETECARCLGRAAFEIDTPFDLFYKPATAAPTGEAEVAIDEGEVEMGFYELPGLVLEDILREQVLLQLPMQTVCSETCKGICPACGVNRNETDCACGDAGGSEVQPGDDRWIALKDIHIEQGRN
ncbi:MAG TPA: DUF177 domain-containing protein [Bryobacteraceae bacterium]|nr:DUF177 domain-containing protein [Bryobacteraceae bacterium]